MFIHTKSTCPISTFISSDSLTPSVDEVHSLTKSHQEAIDVAGSIFRTEVYGRTDISGGDEALIQLKYYHRRIDGSDLWVSLGATINSPATWRRLLQYKPEIVEIGVFPADPPTDIIEENGKPIRVAFYISHTSKGDKDNGFVNEWLDPAPNTYVVSG